MAAEVIRLAVTGGRIMRVAGADNSELVRVVAARFLHRETVFVGLTNIAAVNLRRTFYSSQQIVKELVVREFVVGRKQRVCFRCALKLVNLRQRLVIHSLLGPGFVNGAALTVDLQRKHDSVA